MFTSQGSANGSGKIVICTSTDCRACMSVNIKAMLLVSLPQFCLPSACTVFMHIHYQMFDASWLLVYLTDVPAQAREVSVKNYCWYFLLELLMLHF